MISRRFSLALSLSLLSSAALLGCGQDSDPPALVASARNYIAQNDLKAASIQLKNALQKSPELAEARALLGLTLLEQGDLVGAEVQASKALELGEAPDEAVPLMARLLLLQGKGAQAIERFGATNLSTPAARAALQTVLAQAYLAQGQPERSEAALKAALELDAQHVPAQLLQARLRAASSDLPGARALVGDIVKQHPKDVEAWLLQAALAQAAGDDAAAEQAYRQALASRKEAMGAYVGLIRLLNAQRKFDEADQQLAALKAVYPGHPQTRVLEAQSALRRQDLKAARESIQAVLKVAPDFGYAQQLAGAIEYEAGALAQAVTHLTRAQQLMPESLAARQLLAQALLR
ncbi:tetratricopeptide repeat protein, partial [Azohydromonas aeria]|uniref:tetratricopeptide repeat protein n=1 Tax=Azohydromonas aeria TaxID=2590212 RepID=UPI0018DF67C3